MGRYSPSIGKTFIEHGTSGVTRDQFRQRLADALRRRLAPNTGVTRAVLAHAIGKDVATINNWLAERAQPDSYLMGELIALFDPAFANEVYEGHGVVVAKLSDARRAAAIHSVNRIAPALDALGEARTVVALQRTIEHRENGPGRRKWSTQSDRRAIDGQEARSPRHIGCRVVLAATAHGSP